MVLVYKSDRVQLTKANRLDAGYDIYADEDVTIFPRDSELIRTDLYLEIPEGCVGFIKSRSGLSVKHKLEVGAGVIDSLYRGEVKVHLYNHGSKAYTVYKGDRIAQLVVITCMMSEPKEILALSDTARGDSGFGSSGK
jgi:dUTP pyrophosphatase